MRALVYCNFLREVRLGGWGSECPTLGQYVRVHAPPFSRKWKYIVRFEIIYLLLEIELSLKGLTQSQEKSI